ncbi:hypothetical protein VNO78_18335 [Psophocarpus tetragonolobus]|uniref:Uncharacterized protein n=1 Tax=Psophocarpus tetragonolobus TaxID=3891 RepID=A0AAN9XLY3_PSOTE
MENWELEVNWKLVLAMIIGFRGFAFETIVGGGGIKKSYSNVNDINNQQETTLLLTNKLTYGDSTLEINETL